MNKRQKKKVERLQSKGLKAITINQSDLMLNGKLSIDLLQAKYKSLAKRADTRMRRLEKLAQERGEKGITQLAYAKGMENISQIFGGGRTFERKPANNVNTLRGAINLVLDFLNMQTSTKTGIDRLYDSRKETFKNKYGVDNLEDAVTIFENKTAKRYESELSSNTMLKIIGRLQRDKKKTREWARKLVKKKTRIATNSDEFIKYIANKKKAGALSDRDLIEFLE